MAAAIAMLDEKHPNLPTSWDGHNIYVLGGMHSHNVVIACLPFGIYGTASAAIVAATMRLTFPSTHVGLMVSNGGGVPSARPDIRLGDVVVERPTRDSWGVGLYSTIWQNGQMARSNTRQGASNKPSYAILTGMSRLQAEHQPQQIGVSQILSGLATKYPGAGKF
ncbi:hypothetical protein BJY00DRAFT_276204 [Aspergillus carlsbadensis]|nr:hypothetical protein BJY00DRAFT_276204 [Aspergillus carlsbadensis]